MSQGLSPSKVAVAISAFTDSGKDPSKLSCLAGEEFRVDVSTLTGNGWIVAESTVTGKTGYLPYNFLMLKEMMAPQVQAPAPPVSGITSSSAPFPELRPSSSLSQIGRRRSAEAAPLPLESSSGISTHRQSGVFSPTFNTMTQHSESMFKFTDTLNNTDVSLSSSCTSSVQSSFNDMDTVMIAAAVSNQIKEQMMENGRASRLVQEESAPGFRRANSDPTSKITDRVSETLKKSSMSSSCGPTMLRVAARDSGVAGSSSFSAAPSSSRSPRYVVAS